MQYLGETIALITALSWTATALFADEGSHRLGALPFNIVRMVFSLLMLGILLWIATGVPYPAHAGGSAWLWLALSGVVGYAFGDYCLMNSYVVFGSKSGQLFMTLAPPTAAVAGWLMLGEQMRWTAWIAMLVTLAGIAICIFEKPDKGALRLKLPMKGILFGIGAGMGQGVGLVLSKVGLEHYAADIPADASSATTLLLPFAGTFIRALAGLAGFAILLILSKETKLLAKGIRDRRGMNSAALSTFFGPFLGVSLSLMAVQYTHAGIASTLMALTPVLIILPYSLIHHQRISLREVVGTVITVTGVAMFFLL